MVIRQPQTRGTLINKLSAIAEPVTCNSNQQKLSKQIAWQAHLGNVGCDDGTFSDNVQKDVQPPWKVSPTVLREIEASHSSQSHSQGLEDNGEDIGQKNDK